ncbi:hypothetical protein [Streptomyces sp. NPDC057877]|uniref:hypothetical protein n=1 Tax=Streptomyces sp. NPDC057877 TaxID=3346269 RepID=UPI0036BAB73B
MITDHDIEQAEARVAEVKERGELLRMANRDETADAIRLEVGRLVELKERKAAQDAAFKARKAAERPHASELKAIGAELDSSAGTVDTARQNAARALEELVTALRSHNTAVGTAHARLAALGLPLSDEACDRYDVGHGSAGALRLAGDMWAPVPEDTYTQHVVAEVMRREFGPKHPAARVRDIRLHSLQRGSAGALRVA